MEQPTISRQISAGTRVYYIDGRKDNKGNPYITISEIPTDRSPSNQKRQRVFIHADKIERFAQAFAEVAKHLKNEGEQ